MPVTEGRLKIAVFVDFDNIEIGVKTTLGVAFDIGTILEAIKERGEVVTKIAYGDWTRAGDYSRLLTQHAIRLVQRNLTPGGDKNGADINLALDALEMALTHDHINAYVIVGGDSDFLSLVEKLKQYDKMVFVVGGRAFTSIILQRNCHEFIAYENLINVGQQRRQPERGRPAGPSTGSQSVTSAFPLVRRALKVLSEREVTPQLGLLKSTLLQLDSTFSEKNYGAGSFRDFAEKLAQAGLLKLNQSGRNLLVEIKDVEEGAETAVEPGNQDRGHSDRGDRGERGERIERGQRQPAIDRERQWNGDREPRGQDRELLEDRQPVADAAPVPASAPATAAPQPASMPAPGEALAAQQAEAVALLRRVIENATQPLRWPMYVRNVKQLIRAADTSFDERRYGFGGILDLLRGAQRDGILRLERDRQGVLRVFPGNALQRPAATPVQEATIETSPATPVDESASAEGVETTAFGESIATSEPVSGLEQVSAVDSETTSEATESDSAPVGVIDVEPIDSPVLVDVTSEGEEDEAEPKPKRRRATGVRKTVAARKTKTVRPKGRKKE